MHTHDHFWKKKFDIKIVVKVQKTILTLVSSHMELAIQWL